MGGLKEGGCCGLVGADEDVDVGFVVFIIGGGFIALAPCSSGDLDESTHVPVFGSKTI